VTRLTVVPLRSSLIQGNDKNLGPLSAPTLELCHAIGSLPAVSAQKGSLSRLRKNDDGEGKARLENRAFVGRGYTGRKIKQIAESVATWRFVRFPPRLDSAD
jgi:hypothetical protein